MDKIIQMTLALRLHILIECGKIYGVEEEQEKSLSRTYRAHMRPVRIHETNSDSANSLEEGHCFK